jgi:hypothetical protein
MKHGSGFAEFCRSTGTQPHEVADVYIDQEQDPVSKAWRDIYVCVDCSYRVFFDRQPARRPGETGGRTA